MANYFINISTPLEDNGEIFPNNSSSSEIAVNSPFKEGSIFQEEEEETFPLERKFGKTTHSVKSEK